MKATPIHTNEIGVCSASDCDGTFLQRKSGSKREFCSRACSDRTRKRQMRNTGWVAPHKREGRDPCVVDGCRKPRMAKGYCSMHYERVKKYGDPGPIGSRHRPGEWRLNDGYMVRWMGSSKQLQHRVVMEQTLGRPLERWETVHHTNGVRHDNRPENLELWVKPQPAGQRVEDLVSWILDGYPEYIRAALEDRQQLQLEV